MPGMDRLYEQTLRKALGVTEFTQQVVSRIGKSNQFARKFLKGQETGDKQDKMYWRGPEDHERFAKYALHVDLYTNNHEIHLRPEWMPSGKTEYKRHNLCRFLTNLYTELMMGGGVEVHTPFQAVDDHLNEELEIGDKFDQWAKMASVKGVIGLQVVCDDRGVDVVMVQPELIFAEFEDGSDDDFKWVSKKFYVDPSELRTPPWWEFNKDRKKGEEDDGVVFEERHYRGRIEYYLYTVKGDEITEVLPATWYNMDLPETDPDTGVCSIDTGIDEFMLLPLPNIIFDGKFVSDYADVEDLQRDINSRVTHINRILNIHANPKLILPESYMAKDPYTGEPIMRGLRDEVLFLAEEDAGVKPEYLTWNSQIQEGFAEIDNDVNMFCTVTGVSPSLIVRKDSSFPEAASAYKLRLTPTLARVKFKSGFFKRYVRRILWVLIQKLTTMNVFAQSSLDEKVDDDKESQIGPSFDLEDQDKGPMPLQILTMKVRDIEPRFKAALPQDDRLLVERATSDSPTASLDRVLRDVDGMSEAEIGEEKALIAEMKRLADEQLAAGSGSFFGGGETAGPEQELADGGLGGPETGAQHANINTFI